MDNHSNIHEMAPRDGPVHEEPAESGPIRLDFKYILFILKRGMVFVFAAAVLAGFISFKIAGSLITPVYKARCIVIKHEKRLSNESGIPYLYQETNIETLLETMKLRQNLQRVIDALGLDLQPGDLFGMIEVKRDRNSSILHVIAYAQDPDSAAGIANNISDVFIESNSQILNSSAQQVYQYYISQRSDIAEQIAKAELGFVEFKSKHGVVSIDDEINVKLKRLNDTELLLVESLMLEKEYAVRIADMKSRIAVLPEIVKISETVTRDEVRARNELAAQLEVLRRKYTDENPKVQDVKARLDALAAKDNDSAKPGLAEEQTYAKNSLRETLILNRTTLENQLLAIAEKILGYRNSIKKFKEELGDLSTNQKEYFDAKHKVDIARKWAELIENRIAEAKMAKEANVSDLGILEYAEAPKMPEPTGKKIIAAGTFCGTFFTGTMALFGFTVLGRKIKTATDVKHIERVELLGLQPDRKYVDKQAFYSRLQIIVNRIDNACTAGKPRVITFSSLNQHEGKTTLMNEIAYLKTQSGKRALLVERILVIEKISNMNEIPPESVINDYLFNDSDTIPTTQCHLEDKLYKLYFIVDDDLCRRNLTPEMVARFIEQFSDYDYIFVELFNLDRNIQITSNLMAAAVYNVVVIGSGRTLFRALNNVIREITETSDIKIGAVLNRCHPALI